MVTLLLVWMLLSVGITAVWVRASRHVPTCQPAPIRLPETTGAPRR